MTTVAFIGLGIMGAPMARNLRTAGFDVVAYNRSPSKQFVVIQNRLNAEPMTDYITPVGGGYFFVPPGVRGGTDFVGSSLFS